jgi:hypothetical protein
MIPTLEVKATLIKGSKDLNLVYKCASATLFNCKKQQMIVEIPQVAEGKYPFAFSNVIILKQN